MEVSNAQLAKEIIILRFSYCFGENISKLSMSRDKAGTNVVVEYLIPNKMTIYLRS